MTLPLWFVLLWAGCACAFGAVAFVLRTRQHANNWPSILAIALDQVLFFLYSQAIGGQYRLYFWGYWANACVLSCLQIWLVRDIFRNLPASRWLSSDLRIWTPVYSTVVGLVVAAMTMPELTQPIAKLFLLLNRSAQFSIGAVAVCLLCGFFLSGFGFSRTGYHIALGAVVYTFSNLLLSLVFSLAIHPSPKLLFRITNTADTFISLCVALYWARALAKEPQAEADAIADWEQSKGYLLRELEP